MREMKNSGIEWIGEIPTEWGLNRLQFSLNERNIKNNPVQTNQVLSLVKDKGVMLYEDKGNQGNKAKEDVSEYKLAYPNTLIVNSMNILIGSVGISNYFGCVSPVYYVFEETENADIRFINYIFNTREFQKELRKYANGILEIRLRVAADDIFKRKVPCPSKADQTRIANFLDSKCAEIDALMADIQAQIEILEQYKRSVITEAVTKGLDPHVEMKDSGIEYIGLTPKHWSVERLKYILTERNERSATGEEMLLSVSQYWGVIPSSENKMRTMQANSLVGYKKVKKNDLVFNKLNPGLARFGCSNYNGITSPDFAVYIVNQNKCMAQYLQYLLKTEKYVASFKSIGLGVGDGFARLYTPQLFNFCVSIPCVEEIMKIVEYLASKCSEIDACISTKKEQLSTLDAYKKSLIYEYVTGKKEVPEYVG